MMSLFKKPKKNIRRRMGSSDEDEIGEENKVTVTPMDVDKCVDVMPPKEIKLKKKEATKKTLLSFEEDLNEGDDGEVFKVKKSSQSKKMMKLLDRERKKKKDVKKDDEIDIVIVEDIKPEPAAEVTPKEAVLNGRAAEVAGRGDLSSDEEENHPKFSRPNNVKMLLERGHIPDAAMIHAARKRRQQARDNGSDYIQFSNTSRTKKEEKSRLVREDDEISDDDEERIEMEVNKAARERERRRETFMAAQDEEEIEEDEWESQQIRKGVTGAQLAAVQQEVLYNMYPSPVHVMAPLQPEDIIAERKTEAATPEEVVSKLRDRLAGLKQVHRAHQNQLDAVISDLVSTSSERTRLEAEAPALASRFRFYQELRGYVTDLVECLDEKVPVIESLEQRVVALLRRRADDMMERRRQDVRDQSDEITRVASIKRPKDEEEARTRRAAEREGRRLRRRRAREARLTTGVVNVRHQEGMSSDDEVIETEANAFRSQMQQIESDRSLVFSDVVDDFSTVRQVSRRFERWRSEDWSAYQEAYVSLCLPKVLGPIIRLQLISWSPLDEGEDLERSDWFDVLVQYGLGGSEMESDLKQDPDLLLIPRLVEKMLITKITQMVEAQWDPMSTSQTLRLVGLLNRLLSEYPSLLPSSKSLAQLFRMIVEKMRQAVDQDVYIPILPKQSEQSRSAVFFERQFGSGVKLLRNLLAWQGLLTDAILCEVGLSALLSRYLLTAVRSCDPLEGANKCIMIASTFPRWWFQSCSSILQLQPYVKQARHLITLLDNASPVARDLSERLAHIASSLQPASAS